MADEKIEIEIVLDDGSIKKGFATINREAKSSSKNIQSNFSRSFDNVKSNLTNLGPLLVATFSVGSIVGFVRTLGKFEEALVSVGKTTGFTDRQLQNFGKNILDLSKRLPVTSDELLKISAIAGQLGINDAKQLEKFTDTIARLGVSVEGIDTGELARQLAIITELTGESLDNIDRLGSSLVVLGNNFKTNEGQIARVAVEISKIAGKFKIASSDVLAFSTAFAQSGVQAEVARTTILKVFDAFGDSVSKNESRARKFAKTIGITVDEFKTLVKESPEKALFELVKSFKDANLSGLQVDETLNSLGLSEIRLRTGVSGLIQTVDSLGKALDLSAKGFKDNTALTEESEKAFNTLFRQLTRSVNIFKAIGIELSGNVNKNFGEFIKNLNDLISTEGAVNSLKNLIGTVARLSAAFFVLTKGRVLIDFSKLLLSIAFNAGKLGGGLAGLRVALSLYTAGARKAIVATKAFGIAMKTLKAVATLGLTLAIDSLIQKYVELSNLTPLQNVTKEISSQEVALQKLNAELDRGSKIIQGVRGAKFVPLSEEDKQLLQTRIAEVTADLKRLAEEKKKLSSPISSGADDTGAKDNGTTTTPLGAEAVSKLPDAFAISFDKISNELFPRFNTKTVEGLKELNKAVKAETQQIAASFKSTIGGGVSSAFASFGAAIQSGQDGLEALGNSVLSTLGALAIQIGQFFILVGTGMTATKTFLGLSGSGAIAAGIGLSVLGGVLQSAAGGGGETATASAVGVGGETGGETGAITDVGDFDDFADQAASVVINVEGTVLDPAGVGQQIVELLNEAGFTNGARVIA